MRQSFDVPKMSTFDRPLTITVSGSFDRDTAVSYHVFIDGEPVSLSGSDLRTPVGCSIEPIESAKALCSFLAAYAEHYDRATGRRDHVVCDEGWCDAYTQAERDFIEMIGERLSLFGMEDQ